MESELRGVSLVPTVEGELRIPAFGPHYAGMRSAGTCTACSNTCGRVQNGSSRPPYDRVPDRDLPSDAALSLFQASEAQLAVLNAEVLQGAGVKGDHSKSVI
jgi:hypothetical protein